MFYWFVDFPPLVLCLKVNVEFNSHAQRPSFYRLSTRHLNQRLVSSYIGKLILFIHNHNKSANIKLIVYQVI